MPVALQKRNGYLRIKYGIVQIPIAIPRKNVYNSNVDIMSAIERMIAMQHKDPELMEKIAEYALNYYREHNKMPAIRTIADGVGMNRGSVQKYLVEMADKGIIDYDGKIVRINSSGANTEIKAVYNAGILGSVSCGIPDNVEEQIEEYVPLPVNIFGNGELYILRANGDSMINAGIDFGDLVVVRKTTEAHDGDIVVALTEETGTTLKRLFYEPETGRVILHPENDAMEDMYFSSVAIQGVAVKVIKDL